jgi:two-component system cell cycle sensor histidine kinase/response regulator CckA
MELTDRTLAALRTAAQLELARRRAAGTTAASATGASLSGASLTGASLTALEHELQVHQVEFELQNDALEQSRRALDEALRRYQSLYESAPVGHLSLDTSGLITLCNRATAELLGADVRSLQGRRLAMFLADGSREAFADFLTDVTGPRMLEVELGYEPDGRPRLYAAWVQLYAGPSMPVREAGTELERSLTLLDVTAQRRAEAEAREVARLRGREREWQLVQATLDGLAERVCVIDSSGAVALANARGGEPHDNASVEGNVHAGQHFLTVWERAFRPNAPDVRRVADGLEQVLSGARDEWSAQFAAFPKGDACWFTVRMRRLRGEGAAYAVVALHDVTRERQAEHEQAQLTEQLWESQRMEALGVLAGGIAHDFNNLLSVILGNASLVRTQPALLPSISDCMAEIEHAAERAADLVRQILAFARQDSPQLTALSLSALAAESLRLVRVTMPQGIALHVALDADAPLIRGDAAQLQQVLLNLCANAWLAIDATSGRPGAITVRVEPYDTARSLDDAVPCPEALPAGRHVRMLVIDNGVGMNASTKARMFDPFFTTRPVGRGTGLGLSVVHGIVKAHDGAIAVESVDGVGTTVAVYFPVDVDGARREVRNSEVAPLAGSMHALMVDDDPMVGEVVARLLRREGYTVTVLRDPVRAVALLAQPDARFDVVISDVNMPGLSGLDVARAVRARSTTLPIILVSATPSESLLRATLDLHVASVISKVDLVRALAPAVSEAIERSRPVA